MRVPRSSKFDWIGSRVIARENEVHISDSLFLIIIGGCDPLHSTDLRRVTAWRVLP
jgi:hypothetical protein